MFKLFGNIGVLFFTLFLMEVTIHIIDPSIPYIFLHQNGLFANNYHNLQTQKLYYAIFIAVGDYLIFFVPFLGFLSDILGRKTMLIISSISCLVMGTAGIVGILFHAPLLFIIIFTVGSAFYVYKVLSLATINDYYHRKLSQYKNASMVQFFIGLGVMIGSFLGGYSTDIIVFSKPYIFPFIIMMVIAFVVILILLRYFNTNKHFNPPQRLTRKTFPLLWDIVKQHYKIFFWIILLLLIDQIAWGDFYQYIPSQLKLILNVSPITMGIYMSIIALSLMAFSGFLFPILNKWTNRYVLLLICSFCMLTGYILFFIGMMIHEHHSATYILWIMSAILIAGADVMLFTALLVLGTQLFPQNVQGLATSSLYLIAKLSWIFSGTISGVILYFSHFNTLVPGLIAACILFIMVIITTVRKKLSFTKNA